MRILRSMVFIAIVSGAPGTVAGQVLFSQPAQGGRTHGVVNLTQDFTVRDWGNYHNAQNFSHDGRYIAYTRYASDGLQFGRSEATEMHLFDLHTGRDMVLDKGANPRWAHSHNWLFYTKTIAGSDPEVWWYDADTETLALMGTGMGGLGGVSFDDQWLLGGIRYPSGHVPRSRSVRMRIQARSTLEYLPGLDTGTQWIPNPLHNVVFARVTDRDDLPFVATRYWYDTDGSDVRIGSISLTRCHQAWTGDGAYFLLGNSQIRGRKWNEPFPSSLHFLAAVGTGDVSPCGNSGRFIVGDKPLTIADLRSGDGWTFLEDLSILAYPDNISDDSGPYDSDMKGSPDGTKVNFVSNYDLLNGPVTFITRSAGREGTRLEVQSTAMFPAAGSLVVNREVLSYSSTTPTSFEGLTRRLHQTLGSALHGSTPVTSFEARLIPEDIWKNLPLPASGIQRSMGGMDTPLIRQKSTDLYAAIVRLPDRPWLRGHQNGIEMIPGESHWETYGYHIYRDGVRITDQPIRPGSSLELPGSGAYSAVAVEWSWLESPRSNTLEVSSSGTLRVLHAKPSDFSWTQDVWMVDGRSVSEEEAFRVPEVIREIVHRYDGTIAREWHNWGNVQQRHDLNAEGQAIRRLTYHDGHLFRREYHNRAGQHLSTEYLNAAGGVTEMIRYHFEGGDATVEADMGRYSVGSAQGKKVEYDHWWYRDGMPVRRIGKRPARRIDSDTPVMYVKAGNQWIQTEYVGRFPLQNQNIGEGWSLDRERAREFQELSR